MLIYSPQISTRLKFVCDFIFTSRGLNYRLTNDKREFLEYPGPKLNYSMDEMDAPQLLPGSLLFDEGIRTDLVIDKGSWNEAELLKVNGREDPLCAVFFVLSRYEEYIDSRRDTHNRFEPKNSWQYRFGWLGQPIADAWAEKFIAAYDQAAFERIQRGIAVVPSFDIDNTFAYQWKEGWRKTFSVTKDRIKLNTNRLSERRKVLSGDARDPYDGFEKIVEIAAKFPNTRVFWHLGDYARYDRNLSAFDPRHRKLITDLSQKVRIGIHPSYVSNSSDHILAEEIHRLEAILEKKVHGSRQHFLKLQLPYTYRRLLSLRIKSDYTMGYAQLPGFRIGTARPVMFFDLEKNVPTDLQIIPFVYMDGTFNEYMHVGVEEAQEKVLQLFREIKAYGGVFSFIWHNETITDYGKWKGWSALLDYSLKLGMNAE